MSAKNHKPIDEATIRHIAQLARLAVPPQDSAQLIKELNEILGFVEQLNEVNTENIQPMTGAIEAQIKQRDDIVNDGGYVDKIIANAPVQDDDYFAVPKVVE